jgi:stage V sporulation protein AD
MMSSATLIAKAKSPSRKVGKQTWKFSSDVRILSSATTGGPMEAQGPLANDFDFLFNDLYCGQDTWEKAERKLLQTAIEHAVQKANLNWDDIDLFLAGDLTNQIISSTFNARESAVPYLGMFGACSTSMETLATAAALVDAEFIGHALAGVSSHNATAERQFRYPTEYGGQKPPTAQWTVTGAGAAVVGKSDSGPQISFATMGKVVDMGVKNPMDMGSAMAPAAVDTMIQHFKDTGRTPQDYDLIVTGDLAKVGYPIAKRLMEDQGYPMEGIYQDCGIMIYASTQPVLAGGSGCASSAVTTYGHILNQMSKGTYRRVLIVATGALLSPVSYQQGESIPCIAHAVSIET